MLSSGAVELVEKVDKHSPRVGRPNDVLGEMDRGDMRGDWSG